MSVSSFGVLPRDGDVNGGSVFSGIGLLDYGLHLAGIRHVWGCEADEWRRGIWKQRFRAPCYRDVRDVGAHAPAVELVAGGFPCKGVSTVGKREGFGHPETVLWREMRRAVGELRPRYVVVENVANLLALHDGAIWGEVLGDLAALGYDTEWDCFPAAAFGAPHLRDRVFAVAHAEGFGYERGGPARNGRAGFEDGGERASFAPDPSRDAEGRAGEASGTERERAGSRAGVAVEWGTYEPAIRRWEALHGSAPEPLVRGVDDRRSARVVRSRLSALGDGVLVQAGYFVGARLMAFDAQRKVAA